MTVSFAAGVFTVLAVAYVARIVGAAMDRPKGSADRPPRSRVREVVDALAFPLTMFISKGARGFALSALRVLLLTAEYFVLVNMDWTGEWNGWKVAALLGAPALLILEPLFAMIPVKELSLAAAAYFGQQVAKRVKTTTEEVEIPVVPAEPATPPDNPAEEPTDGSPRE